MVTFLADLKTRYLGDAGGRDHIESCITVNAKRYTCTEAICEFATLRVV